MRFAVCDDEAHFREEIKIAVYEYSSKHRLNIVVDEYSCGEDLIASEYNYKIIFLDYKMEGIDGLETAKQLRKMDNRSAIFFMTSFPRFVYEAFEVNTYRFFKKPIDVRKLEKALDEYFNEDRESKPILLKYRSETVCVQAKEIIFLEANNKSCFVHLTEIKHNIPRTISQVEKVLPKNEFIRVHRAFVLNMFYIGSYSGTIVVLNTGAKIPLSRNYKVAFKEAYMNYVKRRIIYNN